MGIQETCPLETLGIGSWSKLNSGRVLQISDEEHLAGTIVEAGLPNITATLPADDYNTYGWGGAFYEGSTMNPTTRHLESMSGQYHPVYFDASRSNPIYGASDTVQPPAFIVNIWQRIS